MDFPKIIVLHVARGYEDRAAHIEKMTAALGLDFSYMLRGDIADLTPGVLAEFFSDSFGGYNAFTSCSYKHLLAYQYIIDEGLDGAVILEDDAILFPGFKRVAAKAVEELRQAGDPPSVISFEDTRLRFVPASLRRKGTVLYPGDRDRLAGCYYVNRRGAEAILAFARSHKLDRPIDTFHRLMLDKGLIRYWWTHPTVATQGSFTGKFPSSLSSRYSRLMTPLVWKAKLFYRRLLYRFR